MKTQKPKTICRWMKYLLQLSGINTNRYISKTYLISYTTNTSIASHSIYSQYFWSWFYLLVKLHSFTNHSRLMIHYLISFVTFYMCWYILYIQVIRIHFFEHPPPPPGIFHFLLYLWKFQIKQSLTPDIPQNCVRSLGNSKAKNNDPCKFHFFSWSPLEIPLRF